MQILHSIRDYVSPTVMMLICSNEGVLCASEMGFNAGQLEELDRVDEFVW